MAALASKWPGLGLNKSGLGLEDAVLKHIPLKGEKHFKGIVATRLWYDGILNDDYIYKLTAQFHCPM